MTTATTAAPLSFGAQYGPWIGLGLGVLGQGLSAYGQYQGAKAMEREAARQAAEQEALSRAWYERYQALLARISPLTAPAATQANLVPLLRVVSAAQSASGLPTVSAPLMATAWSGRAAALGQRADAVHTQRVLDDLTVAHADLERQKQEAAALYPLRMQHASMQGAGWRLAGDLVTGASGPVMALGFAERQRQYAAQRRAEWEAQRKAEQARLDALYERLNTLLPPIAPAPSPP